MGLCDTLMNDSQTACLYFALVLTLLVLVIMQLWKVGYYMESFGNPTTVGDIAGSEGWVQQTGPGNSNLTSKSGSGRVACFEQPGQGGECLPVGAGVGLGTESLVNNRGEPDFWEISGELGAYRSGQTAGFRQDMASESKERFKNQYPFPAPAPGQERMGNQYLIGHGQEHMTKYNIGSGSEKFSNFGGSPEAKLLAENMSSGNDQLASLLNR